MSNTKFAYTTYIATTPGKLWSALTEAEFIAQYWFGCRCECDWTKGSSWKLFSPDGQLLDDGEILECDPPRRLVIRWQHQSKAELKAEGASICTMQIETFGSAVKLSITHTVDNEPSKLLEAVSGGWPKVLSNLKSLMEGGKVALDTPYPAAKA